MITGPLQGRSRVEVLRKALGLCRRLVHHILLNIKVFNSILPMLVCLRLDRVRERRLEQEQLRKVKTLGAASEDVDDLGAWVSKSRALEEKAKAEARAKALKQARMLEEQVRFPFPCLWVLDVLCNPEGMAYLS